MKKWFEIFGASVCLAILFGAIVFAEERVAKKDDYLYEVRESSFGSGEDVAVLTAYVATASNASIVVPSEIDGYSVEILQGTFQNRKDIKLADIPEGIKEIINGSFENCINLRSVRLPESLEMIDGFKNSGLKFVSIPSNVKSIYPISFYNCKSLKEIEFKGDYIDTIGYNSFAECGALEYIDLPENIEEIQNEAFTNCDSIKIFTIPKGTKKVGDLIVSGEKLEKIINLSDENFYKESFWDETDDTYKWFNEETFENEATFLPANSAVYRKRVKFDDAETYAKKYQKEISDKYIPMDIANTKEKIIEYVKSKAPSDKPVSVNCEIEIVSFEAAMAGTLNNKGGQYGSVDISIKTTNSMDPQDIGEINVFTMIEPTVYAGGSGGGNSSGGSGGSGGKSKSSTLSANFSISITKDSVKNGTWEQVGEKWRLKLPDSSYASSQWALLNDKWYLVDSDGFMVNGWQLVNSKWYYLKPTGEMVVGWKWIGDKCYYMDAMGAMLSNTKTPDGYIVNEKGEWVQ